MGDICIIESANTHPQIGPPYSTDLLWAPIFKDFVRNVIQRLYKFVGIVCICQYKLLSCSLTLMSHLNSLK